MTEQVNGWEATKMDAGYNGWANRETWAVTLHIDNDQGWYYDVLDTLSEARTRMAEEDGHGMTADDAGDIVRENVDETLDALLGSATYVLTEQRRLAALLNFQNVRDDIGSLWRVNWTEVGQHYLTTLDEQ